MDGWKGGRMDRQREGWNDGRDPDNGSLLPTMVLSGRNYFHFKDEAAVAQSGAAAHPRSHSRLGANIDSDTDLSDSQDTFLSTLVSQSPPRLRPAPFST